MVYKIEKLNAKDEQWLVGKRNWIQSRLDDIEEYNSVTGKLNLIDNYLGGERENDAEDEKELLIILGVVFGDALQQDIEELNWVSFEDEEDNGPALRWLDQALVIFPQNAILSRVEDEVMFDIFVLFGDFKQSIENTIKSMT